MEVRMLTLTVKDNDKIYIGDDIVVSIRKSKNQTKVSIDAPRELRILREKLLAAAESE